MKMYKKDPVSRTLSPPIRTVSSAIRLPLPIMLQFSVADYHSLLFLNKLSKACSYADTPSRHPSPTPLPDDAYRSFVRVTEFMTISLDRLPFDVLFYISSHLEFDGIVSLAHTCRQLKTLLNENSICRKAVEVLLAKPNMR